MFVDCRTHPESAARYRVVDANSGVEIHDCYAACEEEGWVLIAEINRWRVLTMESPPCRLEFRRIRIEETPPACARNSTCPLAVGDEVTIDSAAHNASRWNGLTGVIEDIVESTLGVAVSERTLFYSVRVPHSMGNILCRAEDLRRTGVYVIGDDCDGEPMVVPSVIAVRSE